MLNNFSNFNIIKNLSKCVQLSSLDYEILDFDFNILLIF